jgi:long-chain acyl-CoA synthetase
MKQEKTTMPDSSAATPAGRPFVGGALFRPSLQYPVQPYAEILAHTAERCPEQVALVFGDVRLTYRELNALVNSLTNALLSLGIRQGQKVCLFMTNRPEFVISWFAITRAGAVACPLNPAYKEREIAYQLINSEAVALIMQQSFLPLIETVRGQTPEMRHLLVVDAEQENPAAGMVSFERLLTSFPSTPPTNIKPGWEDIVALPYSSGTTGQPKGVMLSHKNLVANACQSIATAQITSADSMLCSLPLYHIYGIMLMGCAAMAGACLVLMERFETGRWLQLIQEEGISIVYSVPQMLTAVADWPNLQEYNLRSVRFNQCGAAPVPPALARRFEEYTGITVMTSYGLTEASPGTHSNPVYNPRLIKVETIGLPIHDTQQKIVDIETGQSELGPGAEGELIVKGPQVMLGYWKAPEATAEALRNGWLHTGDIGWRDEYGYITITDRKKEMIKYKGFSIAPAQIEALLLEHPAISDVAVIAKPDAEAGEIPKAFVVLRRGHEDQPASELIAWVNSKLATYKNVRELEYIASIPRNPSGKILRRVLKEQEKQRLLQHPQNRSTLD